jgi:hypothetical protein
VLEEDANVGWGMNWQNDHFVHNYSISCVMGPRM